MKIKLISLIVLSIFATLSCRQDHQGAEITVAGVKDPVISLNGTWKFSMHPPENFWSKEINTGQWADIQVPGECQMQGFPIEENKPFVYKKSFLIPEDYEGKRILINFHGTYSYARVWINGNFIKDHHGGFTKWECDITPYVTPGKESELTVEITDMDDDISAGSRYAKHQIGGILRDVELIALPDQHFSKLFFVTDLDKNYRNAELMISYELSHQHPVNMKFELSDANGEIIKILEYENTNQSGTLNMQVKDPLKWDAEHPNLYNLTAIIIEEGKETFNKNFKIGFREVEIEGNKLLVNGNEVKLRGACRHDIHPTLGRLSTPEYDKLDVILAKEANMNFIRTSHYPPSEDFLRYCDEFGIYVEDESAVCFQKKQTTDNPVYEERYLSQIREMIHNHRNHPSIIIWSVANECEYGQNIQKSYDWIKENEPTRPVIFSFPYTVPDTVVVYDILSVHYPTWKGNDRSRLGVYGFEYEKMPALSDEWAHVPCYNRMTIRQDPNVRSFWAQSLDSMWINTFKSDGGLGGAIWGMIDETFMLPDTLPGEDKIWGIHKGGLEFKGHCVGYGEWGIIDTWRRKKPEFWGTKKAYSPVKILVKEIEEFMPDKEIKLPVLNRFDHTNFNELKIKWEYKGRSGYINDLNIEPHESGSITIPASGWENGKFLTLVFYQHDTLLVDVYQIITGEKEIRLPEHEEGELQTEELDDFVKVTGKDYSMLLNKKSGLINDLKIEDEVLIKSGPYANFRILRGISKYHVEAIDDLAKNWKCDDFDYQVNEGILTINAEGKYDSISARFRVTADERGILKIDYTLSDLPEGRKIQESGIKFISSENFLREEWDRKGYFTFYPDDDIGKINGKSDITYHPEMHYRKKPYHDWIYDTGSFYYFAPGNRPSYTNITRSLKENIYSYSLISKANNQLKVHSDGTQACRFDRIYNDPILIINDDWDYADLLWGNYIKNIISEEEISGSVVLINQKLNN